MDFIVAPVTRAIDQASNIINCVMSIVFAIFEINGSGNATSSSYMSMLISTIGSNDYLLISVSLVLVGFVIGILKRIIHD